MVYDVVRVKTKLGTIVAGPCTDVKLYYDLPVVVLDENSCSDDDDRVICAPIKDFGVRPVHNIALAVAAVIDALNEYGEVGVCCAGGCGRTGIVVTAVKAVVDNVDPLEAMEEFSKMRMRTCPETCTQRLAAILIAELAKKHGIEKTLELLAMIEKPWVIEANGARIVCKKSKTAVIGYLTRLVMRVMKRGREVHIDDEKAKELLGDLYDVARDMCKLIEKYEDELACAETASTSPGSYSYYYYHYLQHYFDRYSVGSATTRGSTSSGSGGKR